MKKTLLSALLLLVSVTVALAVGELALRLKNASMNNYDIEMWRYARELKVRSDNPILGHEHVPNESAVLQSVPIRINAWGLRGGPVRESPRPARRILFLGSSITLGWGVPEADTLTSVLARQLQAEGQDVEVLNGGIGNYNTERYVERFLTRLTGLAPTDIVVQYFVNDAEVLDAGRGDWVLRNSYLAATLWIASQRFFGPTGEAALEDHYRAVYDPDSPGYRAMTRSLERLANYARAHQVHLYLAMTPDIHKLGADYPFGYIHDTLRALSARDGYRYIDLLPAFAGLEPPQVWAMPGDPHPNALGHRRMAETIYPVLAGRD